MLVCIHRKESRESPNGEGRFDDFSLLHSRLGKVELQVVFLRIFCRCFCMARMNGFLLLHPQDAGSSVEVNVVNLPTQPLGVCGNFIALV